MKEFNIDYLKVLESIDFDTFYKKDIEYINLVSAFDIETSSFRDLEGRKTAIMYIWQFGIENTEVIYGRTWEDFVRLIGNLANWFNTNFKRRLIIYVHNLGYEFQFIKKYFQWSKIFALDKYKPIYCVTTNGIEFRCSYLESNMSLAKLPTKIKKLIGNLDYQLIRTPETPLTTEELAYCENDILVVIEYIKSKGLKNVQLTSTGYIRNMTRDALFNGFSGNEQWKRRTYRKYMESLDMDMEFYTLAKEVFAGGYTHANASYVGQDMSDVISFDLTSAYPSVMVYQNNYPISKFVKTEVKNKEHFNELLATKCCFFRVEIENLESKCDYDHYIQVSKILGTFDGKNGIVDNGRLVKYSGRINLSLNDIDWSIIKETYNMENVKVYDMWIANRGYLPKDLILVILELYSKKTKLKGMPEYEYEYNMSKALINAVYGMCVTAPVRKQVVLTDNYEWTNAVTDDTELLTKYNENKSRFLYYPWGVYVTSNVRRILWDAILLINKYRHIYSDTDSCKLLCSSSIEKQYEMYNDLIAKKLKESAEWNDFDISLCYPKNLNGEEKPLGFWECEGKYSHFKTLGAKRYIFLCEGELFTTVAGISKDALKNYLIEQHGNDFHNLFKHFQIGLKLSKEKSKKLTHTYIEDIRQGVVKDYLNNYYEYTSLSGVHLEPTSFEMTMAASFADYLLSIKTNNI